MTIEILKTIW
jgi:hypothetical protein